jgi:sphingolipid delta-4 desaturase
MHECAHNLVFRNPTYSKVMGIIGDFGLLFPGAMAFRKYHLMHHQHLGVYEKDPDIVSRTEGNIVGNSAIRKAIWVSVLGVSQALRPLKVTGAESSDRWLLVNIVAVVIVDIVIFVFFGPKALVYLGLSTLFALGLHPVGGRWIQEHHTDGDGQETHSYYGPLNKLSFNIGYHNEHHDFASIPWNNLPKLKKLAPDYYDTLNSYKSWTKVLFRFIFDKSMSTFSRIVHEPPGQNGGSKHAQTSEPRSDDSSIGDQR